MTHKHSCPFAGTTCGQYCSLLTDHQTNNTYHLCQYQFECTQIKEHLEQHQGELQCHSVS